MKELFYIYSFIKNKQLINIFKFLKIKNDKITDIKNENKENEENEENKVLEEDIELTNRLKLYFHSENGELNKARVTFNELEKMEDYYKSLLDKNKNIENIKEYQRNYIELEIKPQLKLIQRERLKKEVKGRIEKLENILNKLKKKRK